MNNSNRNQPQTIAQFRINQRLRPFAGFKFEKGFFD